MTIDEITLDELVEEYWEKTAKDIPTRLIYTSEEAYARAFRECLKENKRFTNTILHGRYDVII